VRPGSRTKVSVPLALPQNRHPERSASPIDRVTQRLWRGVEGDLGDAYLAALGMTKGRVVTFVRGRQIG
jgi:hypothetical protein